MISKAQNKIIHLIIYLNGCNMRSLLIIFLLSSCANVKDNTTVSDKAVIGAFFTVMALGAKGMAQ